MQDTLPCRPEVVKEIAGVFVRLGEKATEVLRRLEERPAFPGAQQSALFTATQLDGLTHY